ncbi:hypothetical protein COCNU_13G005380 [Cocos nucifera]|uniref:Uncharacterized protein n=1 Tax=Cocos nucifera TaxID=13894 RepID=A0A8K0ITM2_COCNU|nr:hypothetical protein COCNU_13G005380 [Cocos nucifera]
MPNGYITTSAEDNATNPAHFGLRIQSHSWRGTFGGIAGGIGSGSGNGTNGLGGNGSGGNGSPGGNGNGSGGNGSPGGNGNGSGGNGSPGGNGNGSGGNGSPGGNGNGSGGNGSPGGNGNGSGGNGSPGGNGNGSGGNGSLPPGGNGTNGLGGNGSPPPEGGNGRNGSSGCLKGRKVRNPAEKIRTPFLTDFRRRLAEVAEEATEQDGTLLLISFTEQDSITFISLLISSGRRTLNTPRLLVFTSLWKESLVAASSHSTATEAPVVKVERRVCQMFERLELVQVRWMRKD